jgi:outer membrane protein OmpA-like peptidoglycan-associated protein
MEILNAGAPGLVQTYSKALLIMAAKNAGGISAGILGSIGYVSLGDAEQLPLPNKGQWTQEISVHHDGQRDSPVPALGIELPGDVLFDFDKFNLKPSAAKMLEKAGDIIKSHPGHELRIMGFTDSLGTAQYNKTLSEKRALAVKKWLVLHQYRKDSEVDTEGLGARFPVATNDNEAGRQKNRRVEILIIGVKR